MGDQLAGDTEPNDGGDPTRERFDPLDGVHTGSQHLEQSRRSCGDALRHRDQAFEGDQDVLGEGAVDVTPHQSTVSAEMWLACLTEVAPATRHGGVYQHPGPRLMRRSHGGGDDLPDELVTDGSRIVDGDLPRDDLRVGSTDPHLLDLHLDQGRI